MIIEIRIDDDSQPTWENIAPRYTVELHSNTDADNLAQAIAEFEKKAVRWNRQGLYQGHYHIPSNQPVKIPM
jgi:hypothetical protein